jgi:alpha-glucosidase
MVDGYAQADMPLEGVWIDIPEMDNFQDFTINKTAFPDLPGFTATLHSAGQKLVVIVDAGLSADDLSNKYFA